MKALIVAALMAFGATSFAMPAAQAASFNDYYAWKGVRYDVGRFYGCWTVRYGKHGWNRNCDCEVRQRVILRDGERIVRTVRECRN